MSQNPPSLPPDSPSFFARFAGLRLGFLPQKLRPFSPLLVIGVLVGAGLFFGRGGAGVVEEKGDGLKRVQVTTVRLGPVVAPRILPGTLRARIETDIAFRVGGKIAERKVQAGDRVRAGTVLALIDAGDFRLTREAAEAELGAATSSHRQQELDFARVSELRARGFSTAQSAEARRAALDEARGRLERARRQAELAANNEAYTRLTADAAGIVAGVFAEAGQVVAAGQAVLRLARDGEREAQVAIPEQDLDFVRKAVASAALWSEPERRLPARLRELSPSADPGTRTFLARYTLEGLSPGAPLGMTATLSLSDPATRDGLRLPLSALLNEGGGAEVFVLAGESNRLERRRVELIGYDARDALIASGLQPGERVVTLGVHTLLNGQKVVPLPEQARGN